MDTIKEQALNSLQEILDICQSNTENDFDNDLIDRVAGLAKKVLDQENPEPSPEPKEETKGNQDGIQVTFLKQGGHLHQGLAVGRQGKSSFLIQYQINPTHQNDDGARERWIKADRVVGTQQMDKRIAKEDAGDDDPRPMRFNAETQAALLSLPVWRRLPCPGKVETTKKWYAPDYTKPEEKDFYLEHKCSLCGYINNVDHKTIQKVTK